MKFDELFKPKPGSRAEFRQNIIDELNQEIESLKSEVKEQAVLNGKGSEREARYLAACSEYRAKLDKLERENVALRADKERLDWLQSATVRVGDVLTHFLYSEDVDLRAAIDAARKEQE
jgi:ABC-type phosphate transport system auxiliary subunit